MTEPTNPDFARYAPAITALCDRMETIARELDSIDATRQQLTDAMSAQLERYEDSDDGTYWEALEAAGADSGIRQLNGWSLEVHARLRGWCAVDRIKLGDDHGR
jgi:hypothetical protein